MIYQFPSEPFAFDKVGGDALDELRWRLRVPVIRQFGAAASECLAIISKCEHCNKISAAMSSVTSRTFETDWHSLIDYFGRSDTWRDAGLFPTTCSYCHQDRLAPLSAFIAKFMPSVNRDFQISVVFHARRVHRVETFWMDPNGHVEPFPVDEMAGGAGIPLSIRGAWRQLVSDQALNSQCVVQEVRAGYTIGMRPYTDSAWTQHALHQEAEQLLGVYQADGYDLFVIIGGEDTPLMGLAHADLYHNWLGAYAADVDAELIDLFAFVKTSRFFDVLTSEARRHGLSVYRQRSTDALWAVFCSEDLEVKVDLTSIVHRTVHSGLSFHEGIVRFFGRQLSGICAGAEAIPLLKKAFPDLSISILNGTELDVRDQQGRRLAHTDIIHLATSFDLRNRSQYLQACAEIAPNVCPEMVTLTPPIAGRLSAVIARQ